MTSGDVKLSGYSRFRTNPKSPELQFVEINSDSVEVTWTNVPDVELYLVAITTTDNSPIEKEVSAITDTFRFENLVKSCKYN